MQKRFGEGGNSFSSSHRKQLMIHLRGETLGQEEKEFLREYEIAGVILYEWANGLESPFQVRSLVKQIREANPKIVIAVDQEGGAVQRIRFQTYSSPREVNPQTAYQWAYTMGKELADLGISMTFAPVVDCFPCESSFASRSFGNDPNWVISCAREALKGWIDAGICPVLKHFPGHGAVNADSHEELPIVTCAEEELLSTHVRPFIELQAPAIMTAHLLIPYWDEQSCVTLSSKILKKKLREEWGFKGWVISDSLVMQAIRSQCASLKEAVQRTAEAGCDWILLGGRGLKGQEEQGELTLGEVSQLFDEHLIPQSDEE